MPTIVVHGENDLVVPFESAQDMAERADGTLYRVPGAYHSWMLANPRHGADMMRQLLAAELGDVLRDAARAHGIMGVPGGWQDALLTADSPLHSLEEAARSRPSASSRSSTSKWTGCAVRAVRRAARTARRSALVHAWRRRRGQTSSAGTADIA